MTLLARKLFFVTVLLLKIITVKCDDDKPFRNVLFILCDDSGKEMGTYGYKQVKSPNLDYLANHSVVFDYGYTSVSSCSPSRSTLLTGMPIHQNGMYGLANDIIHYSTFQLKNGAPYSLSKILMMNNYYTGVIGKYHIAPYHAYPFNYSRTEYDGYNLLQVARNITCMKQYVQQFLDNRPKDQPFFLYIPFLDTHRGCFSNANGSINAMGPFCNNFGNRNIPGMGDIADWDPVIYDPDSLELPFWISDNNESRQDYAAYLTTFSRLDQGVGLFIKEFEKRGLLNNTLIYLTSDNGEPFPTSKTNFYEQGQIEPYMISTPDLWQRNNTNGPIYSNQIVSALDLVPTVLDWCNIPYPKQQLNGITIELTGNSLMPLVNNLIKNGDENIVEEIESAKYVYGSYNIHEVTMYYPMRSIRDNEYRLIHNLEYNSVFHLATDLYWSPSWQSILNCTKDNINNNECWYKDLNDYYFRKEWELFNIKNDPQQLTNLAYNNEYYDVFERLSNALFEWQNKTMDPWAKCDQTDHFCYQWIHGSQTVE